VGETGGTSNWDKQKKRFPCKDCFIIDDDDIVDIYTFLVFVAIRLLVVIKYRTIIDRMTI